MAELECAGSAVCAVSTIQRRLPSPVRDHHLHFPTTVTTSGRYPLGLVLNYQITKATREKKKERRKREKRPVRLFQTGMLAFLASFSRCVLRPL